MKDVKCYITNAHLFKQHAQTPLTLNGTLSTHYRSKKPSVHNQKRHIRRPFSKNGMRKVRRGNSVRAASPFIFPNLEPLVNFEEKPHKGRVRAFCLISDGVRRH